MPILSKVSVKIDLYLDSPHPSRYNHRRSTEPIYENTNSATDSLAIYFFSFQYRHQLRTLSNLFALCTRFCTTSTRNTSTHDDHLDFHFIFLFNTSDYS